jgi:hypothetical protein
MKRKIVSRGEKRLLHTLQGHKARRITKRNLSERKTTHPWVGERVLELVREKKAAEGTNREHECRDRCSAGIMEEYGKYVAKERTALQNTPRGKKGWWSKSRRLMQKKGVVSSIPALRTVDGTWILESRDKANLFAITFSTKYKLADAELNEYTELEGSFFSEQRPISPISEEEAAAALSSLCEESGTGPDLLPTRILKQCAEQLARPVQLLTMMVLSTGMWPEAWLRHWIVPLFKKKSVYDPSNYRYVHLTAQLSKVVERLIKSRCMPYIKLVGGFGPNQFASTPKRGARDALALLTLTWLQSMALGRKIAVYYSDVSGAFDRVRAERLIAKLKAWKVHSQIIAVIKS